MGIALRWSTCFKLKDLKKEVTNINFISYLRYDMV